MKIRKRKINGNLEPVFNSIEKRNSFLSYVDKIKEGQEIVCEYNSISETRSIDANSRLWVIYTFMAKTRGITPLEVHKELGEKYLMESTVFDPSENDFFDVLQDILNNGRKECNAIIKSNKFYQDNKLTSVQIIWVRSTASLKKSKSKETDTITFSEYMEAVENEAAELGLILGE